MVPPTSPVSCFWCKHFDIFLTLLAKGQRGDDKLSRILTQLQGGVKEARHGDKWESDKKDGAHLPLSVDDAVKNENVMHEVKR